MLNLKCTKCKREHFFAGATEVTEKKIAEEKGWTLIPEVICPDCINCIKG